jgi:GPH family glycoside/pentoside/hexuronide:cation symporter
MIEHPQHTTAPEDRIPVSQKFTYGLGAVVTIVAVNSVMQLSGLVYVVGLGISIVWTTRARVSAGGFRSSCSAAF